MTDDVLTGPAASERASGDANAAPYTIDLVPVDRGWILEKIAHEIAREAAKSPERYRVSMTTEPSGHAELTFFLPESAWRDDVRDTIRVTYLAHKEHHAGAAALFEEVARKSDVCITSSSKYADVLRADGAREVHTIALGVDTDVFVPKVRIGVVGRTYHTGRKGETLLAAVMDLPFIEFVFTGEGWPLPAQHYGERELAAFYQSLDYLLVPSLIEGGPVPMLEALSAGCPVIAPSDIGMVRDFPHIPFRRGDADDLRRVLEAELEKVTELRAAALPCDWEHFARRHLELFAQLIDRRRASSAPARRPISSGPLRACRALLVTHGTEDWAKGGPTTRVRNIVAQLQARCVAVETASGPTRIASGRYDVVHVFNSWPPDSAIGALAAARRSGARVVFSPIALDLADWPLFRPFMERLFDARPGPDKLIRTLATIVAATPRRRYAGEDASQPVEGLPGLFEKLRLACELADQLVLLSDYERSYLSALGARVDHAVTIHNGVDVETMRSGDPELFRARFGLRRYVLAVGRLEYRKNQALVALAARNLEVPLVLVGAPGDPGYAAHVKRLGGSNVHFIERIEDRALLASAYAGAEALVFPSWTEGAPLAAMEAGAAGTPLVLGNLSSERELFGDDARYVHPADVAAIAGILQDLIRHPEPEELRRERSRRFVGAFSIARHAEETWALYERLHAQPEGRAAPPVVADVSALLHFVRMGQPFTGVPLVEHGIVSELLAKHPSLRLIAYNDVKSCFIEIDFDDIEAFDQARFNARHWFVSDEHLPTERRAMLTFADRTTAPLPDGMQTTPPRAPRVRSRAVALGKRMIQRAPDRLRRPAVALLRRIRPTFDPYRIKDERAPGALMDDGDIPARPLTAALGLGERRFEHPLGTLTVAYVPRRTPPIPVGARVLTLGQSWLSNESLLDELVRLTRMRSLTLEPYVYDLTYHTGAHHTGWEDNAERFARLLTLLRHSARVYTESKQVENDLRKLAASRGFSYETRRTGLRGRDLRTIEPRDDLHYRPDGFVLMVSSFNRRKNHDFLLNVWTTLHETWIGPSGRDFRLVLVGPVQEERKFADSAYRAQLRAVNVDVHNDVPDGVLARLYRDCAFTVYPSLQEGWGLPAQESLMCGKVCLVSNTLPVAEEIRNPALIPLAPSDFYGWYEALKTWLDNVSMRRAFEMRAREYRAPTWAEIAGSIIGAG